MATESTKGVPIPETTDDDKPRLDIGKLALWVDDHPGISAVTTEQRNSLTELWVGRVIFNLTTGELQINPTGVAGDWFAIFTSAAPLPVANGGTGLAVAPSMLVNLGSTAPGSPLQAAPRPGVTGVLQPANGGTGGMLPIAYGGTGQNTAAGARSALGLGATTGPLPVANGGTGGGTPADARANLGITPGNIGAAGAGHGHALTDDGITGALPVSKGGTGQTTPAGARNALGLGNTSGPVPVANGGTGGGSAADARANIGAAPVTHIHDIGDIAHSAYNNGGRNGFWEGYLPDTYAARIHGHHWDQISGKPGQFTPANHVHDVTDIWWNGEGQGSFLNSYLPNTYAPRIHGHHWDQISGRPGSYAPSPHDHGRIWQNDGSHYLALATDASGARLFTPQPLVYGRTHTEPANMVVTSGGTIGRSTSIKAAKLDVEDQAIDPLGILNITPRAWTDRGSVERAVAEGYDEPDKRRRTFGAVVEEVAPHAPYLVTTDSDGAPDGLAYDRFAIALIPTLRHLVERICVLEGKPAPEWPESPTYDDAELWQAILSTAPADPA